MDLGSGVGALGTGVRAWGPTLMDLSMGVEGTASMDPSSGARELVPIAKDCRTNIRVLVFWKLSFDFSRKKSFSKNLSIGLWLTYFSKRIKLFIMRKMFSAKQTKPKRTTLNSIENHHYLSYIRKS